MFDLNSRARQFTLGALICVATATAAGCAHSQQAPPADSASPRARGQWGRGDGPHMRHRSGPHGDRMMKDLNLSQDQRGQVRLIRDRYRLKADSLRMGGAARDSTSRAAFHSVMMQQMTEIRAVLTPDQQKKFDDKMAKMRAHRGPHDGRARHKGPPPDDQGGNPPPPPPR